MSGLPSGYTQLEYIQSSGTQWIDTGFDPNQNTGVTMDFQLTAAASWQCLFGAANNSSNAASYAFWHSGTSFGFYFGNANNTIAGTATSRHIIIANKNVATLDDSQSVSIANSQFETNYPILLFAPNYAGASPYPAKMRLYSCQIYDNGTLVRDFIPCINASGAIGLYDIVDGQFYANAGSGTFTAGPEIIPNPPDTPTQLQTVLAVVLQWAASANADRYDVYRDGAKLGSTETAQYVDTTPEANQTYVYTVKAVNGGGESAGTSITVYTKSGYFEYKPLIESANFP